MIKKTIRYAIAAVLLSSNLSLQATTVKASRVAEFPLGDGHGTAGAFIGALDNSTAIIAGGSDFLTLRPWEGGSKSFLDGIWILTRTAEGYRCIKDERSSLPYGMAGGCSAVSGKALYCFGGQTAEGSSSDILKITRNGSSCSVECVGKLPEGFKANAATTYKGQIFIHGSQEGANALYKLSPESMQWTKLSGCPERLLSEGSSLVYQHNGKEAALYLIGGRGTDKDGLFMADHVWEYLPLRDSWERKAAFASDGKVSNLMYGTSLNFGSAHVLTFGGDDGVEFTRREKLNTEIAETGDTAAADSLRAELAAAFTGHQGFSDKVYAYHAITDTWTELATTEFHLPAVTTAIMLGDKVVLVSGEQSPGVRSNAIIELDIKDEVSFGWLNYAVVVLYLLGMLGIGFYFSRKNNSTEKFFKGGGNIPWWAAGISIFATALSAITFLSIPAKAYAADWKMFMFNMTIILIVPVVINFYLPLIKKLNVASVYQYLEERFGSPVRYLASAFFCLFMFARVAIVLFLPSLALNAVTGMNVYLCIVLMGVVTIIYCTMGGIEAVVWGDVIQGFLLVGGALLSLVWIIHGIDGGFGKMMTIAIDESKFHIFDLRWDLTQPVLWVALIGGLANQFLTYTSDQSVVQKYLTVKDDKGTRKGLWLNGILTVPITFLFFGIGTGLYVFFKQHPGMLNVGMTNTDSIFPHYMMCQLPAGIAGLLIAAVFAAAMSTLASNINSSTTVMSVDFFSRLRPQSTDLQKVKFAKTAGIIVGGLGVIMALALATFDIASLWDQFNFFLGLLTSGLGGLFMMGIFTKRIGMRAALTGFIGSIVVLLWFSANTAVTSTFYGFIGLVSCFIIGYLSSFFFGYRK